MYDGFIKLNVYVCLSLKLIFKKLLKIYSSWDEN